MIQKIYITSGYQKSIDIVSKKIEKLNLHQLRITQLEDNNDKPFKWHSMFPCEPLDTDGNGRRESKKSNDIYEVTIGDDGSCSIIKVDIIKL